DNALLKLAPLLSRLAAQPDPAPDADAARVVSELLGTEVQVADVADAAARVGELDPQISSYLLAPMMGISVTPTRAAASQKENVIPARSEVLVDCRVPPGVEEPEVRRTLEALLGPGEYEIDFINRIVG